MYYIIRCNQIGYFIFKKCPWFAQQYSPVLDWENLFRVWIRSAQKMGLFSVGLYLICHRRQKMGISDKNGLMVNSEKAWFPFRGTCRSAHSTSPRAAARQHITPLQGAGCLPASHTVPQCCTPQRLRVSFRVHCTQAAATLENMMSRLCSFVFLDQCSARQCGLKSRVHHWPWKTWNSANYCDKSNPGCLKVVPSGSENTWCCIL